MSLRDDIFLSLQIDPGQRTLGQLLQDREAAFHEILRLRKALDRACDGRGESMDYKQDAARSGVATLVERPQAFRFGTLIRMSEVCEVLGLSRSTIYKLLSEGRFPEPVQIGDRAVRWRVEQVEAWRDAPKSRPQ